MMGLSDHIELIAVAMRNDPSPAEMRGYEVSLASYVWGVNLETARAEVAFKRAIQDAPEKTAAARRQYAEAGPAFERLLTAQAVQQACLEMLRTCRSTGRSLNEEMRLAR
jgi:hypothetical protein